MKIELEFEYIGTITKIVCITLISFLMEHNGKNVHVREKIILKIICN